jgi:sugar phosphate isomerase/epimerase
MFPVGICTGIVHADTLKAAGADYLEEHVQNLLKPEQPDFAFLPVALPVRAANCFLPNALKCVGPAVDTDRLVRYAGVAFQRAQQTGIATVGFGCSKSRQIPDGFPKAKAEEQFVALLRALGPIAGRHGVTLVVEPLNRAECNFINSVPEAAVLAAAARHPNIAVLADFYHMCHDGQTPDDIRQHGTWLRHVHIAEKENRTAPGMAGDDFRPFLKALKQVNYRHAISIEANWGDLPAEAGQAVAELRRQINAA